MAKQNSYFKPWLISGIALALSACDGGQNSPNASAAELASSTTTFALENTPAPEAATQQLVQPAFHIAPVLLNPPDDADQINNDSSARRGPQMQVVPTEFSYVSTRRLTLQALQNKQQNPRMNIQALNDGKASPMAAGSVVSTYTPAQIRAAYGLPALPALGATLTPAQAAQLGAGQTIYIVDAMHNPNTAAELAAFNQRFGLPTCTTKTIAVTSPLPLPAASKSGCELSVVYNTASGGMTTTAPNYDEGWATEITLDVQWAHATAPLARIIVIEAADASINSLLGAIKLANNMGPGIVSMSFGANEGSWSSSVDSVFTASNMTYLAATGDSGAAVSWPSVSSNVLAVGGTTLNYSGTGSRSEVAWSGTGGGSSAYTPLPVYQNNSVPGMGTRSARTVADVAFNADPASGQYVAVIAPGSASVNWISAGGTSLSTPQWAGLIAVANANRLLNAKPVLGAAHKVLYGQISTVAGTYASAFTDIKTGTHGSCGNCSAKTGYDQLTGLGTPNGMGLLAAFTGSTATTPPTVTSAAISGQVGKALTFTVSATAPNTMTYTLTGAPAGMSINTSGVVSWATPLVGTYPVTVTAKDSKTGLSGQGVYTVTIAPIPAPVVTSANISGKVGTTLNYSVVVTAPNAVTYTLTGAPKGMTISTTGVLSWPTPVAGSYNVTVTAKDSKTALTGKGNLVITIAAQPAPVIAAATINGKIGTTLSFTVAVTAPNPVTFTMTGAPSGMSINNTGLVSWAKPVLGTYSLTISAKDSKTGLSGQGVYTVKITQAGPVISAAAMTGVAGKPLTSTISISDPGATYVSISVSGVPLGMGFSVNGLNLTAIWPSPVTGSYSLKVLVTDNLGLSSQATIPITITAK